MNNQQRFHQIFKLALAKLPPAVRDYVQSGKVLILYASEKTAAYHIRSTPEIASVVVFLPVLLRHPIQRQLDKILHEISHVWAWHIGLVDANSTSDEKERIADRLVQSWG